MAEPASLVCSSCTQRYEPAGTEPYRCSCGAPLELAAPQRSLATLSDSRLMSEETSLTLGEGNTPSIVDDAWGVRFKLEWQSPTGSFKDRGAAAMLARASALGVDRVIADSSGNAGVAVATYAARAGIDAEIFVPAAAGGSKRRLIEQAGATLRPIEGDRAAVTEHARRAVDATDVWYASHAWRPSFLAGTATFGAELAAGGPPDAVVIGTGNGTLLLGAYRGLQSAQKAGQIERLPRLYAAQPTGYAPLVEGEEGPTNSVADGMHITAPPREQQLRDALRTTNGGAIAVTATQTTAALSRLHTAGYQVEPSCAVAPAAVEQLRDQGEIDPGETVVVPLTGFGK